MVANLVDTLDPFSPHHVSSPKSSMEQMIMSCTTYHSQETKEQLGLIAEELSMFQTDTLVTTKRKPFLRLPKTTTAPQFDIPVSPKNNNNNNKTTKPSSSPFVKARKSLSQITSPKVFCQKNSIKKPLTLRRLRSAPAAASGGKTNNNDLALPDLL